VTKSAIELAYLLASLLFILGLRGLRSPETARRGILLAELAMLVAIAGTLLHHRLVRYRWSAYPSMGAIQTVWGRGRWLRSVLK
jgi:NAD(P) transhydrogenase subunit beta